MVERLCDWHALHARSRQGSHGLQTLERLFAALLQLADRSCCRLWISCDCFPLACIVFRPFCEPQASKSASKDVSLTLLLCTRTANLCDSLSPRFRRLHCRIRHCAAWLRFFAGHCHARQGHGHWRDAERPHGCPAHVHVCRCSVLFDRLYLPGQDFHYGHS